MDTNNKTNSEYKEVIKAIKANQPKGKPRYYILLRGEERIQFVSLIKGSVVSFFDREHPEFNTHVSVAALHPDTVIHTLDSASQQDYKDASVSRLYQPSHVDAAETRVVVREITGVNL